MEETTAGRIRKARIAAKLTHDGLAKACGVSRAAVSQWEAKNPAKRTTPSLDNFQKISKATGYAAWWLQSGEGEELKASSYRISRPEGQRDAMRVCESKPSEPADNEHTFIPLYEIAAAAGPGRRVEHELVEGYIAFRSSWLRTRHYNSADLVIIHAEGDSMAPSIGDGDMVVIDCTQRRIKSGRIYALRAADELRIKRLFWQTDGSLLISSDNKSPDHRDEIVPTQALEDIHIIGEAVWRGGNL